jgi:beta-N-acetylhexosaminidase
MSAAAVGALTSSLQAGSPLATQGVALYVAADQEGGSVQELSGSGFTAMPPAIVQGRTPPRSLLSEASGWAGQWARSGLNLDLAPVADVVPADQVRTNQVDGIYGRELGSDPVAVAGDVAALVQGLQSAGVGATLKHFPGLGRVTDNTDTAPGVTDTKTSARDPDLGSFTAGIAAGARFVMVSLARYDLIDPTQPAVYSPVVITQLLRHSLGFGGVVISDDLGAAASAQSLPVGERAAAFIRAGGDIALVVGPASSVAPMVQGLEAAAANDPGLQAQIGTAVRKVLTDKIRAGLISC